MDVREAPRYRFMINSDQGDQAAAQYGYNLLDVGSAAQADGLPAGSQGLIWVGDYNNSSCSWEQSDATVRTTVTAALGDARVLGYFFSDEPDPFACPNAYADHKARSDFIHSIDPLHKTVMLIDSNSGQQTLDQIRKWAGAADYFALDPYPCYQGKPCNYGWIDQVIAAANNAGLNYWGVAQVFQDSVWRWPTVDELNHMLSQWAASRQSGMMTFAWTWAGRSLTSQPRLLATLKRFNQSSRRPIVARSADEVHYTYTSSTSIAFDWRGTARTIRYGLTSRYGRTARASLASPVPTSSGGPFWEVKLARLKPATTYHYSIGGGPDYTFATAPMRRFRFDVEGDVGDSGSFSAVGPTQVQIAADKPAFVLVVGDLTYGNDNGQTAVDGHFNDVMVWSRRAAYMPAWGNHEWDTSTDDLRNYKGRFAIPHGQASPGAPSEGCCGEDWGWFDAGGVRFISYPEPYTGASWSDWQAKAGRLMAAAQANRRIKFIVTFGHRPAYSTGYHSGDDDLASILNTFGDRYSKYVLNLNGHSHDYERFVPIHHVVHITAAGGGASLETPWGSKDPRTAYRAMHLAHVRVDVTATRMRIQVLCGPPSSGDDVACRVGTVIDSYTITAPT